MPLVPHVRNEGNDLLAAMEEMIGVARRSGAPLHISHLKSLADERLIGPLLDLLDAASRDVSLSFDQYPYGAGSTILAALLPAWAQEGGAAGTLARVRSPDDRRRIAAGHRTRASRLGEHPRDARAGGDRDREHRSCR